MIGRLVLSDRNIYKINSGTKQITARKCNILSQHIPDILIKTSKEFNSHDEYIKFNPDTNIILEGLGQIGIDTADKDIYYHLFTYNWLSMNKYSKLWDDYLDKKFDLAYKVNIERTLYKTQVITIDPKDSIDLDDGFSFISDEMFWNLDIHIADPVSLFDFDNPKFKPIYDELIIRLQTCYISQSTKPNNHTHLLPPKIVELVSLLEINSDSSSSSSSSSKRALSFCFKIAKQTNQIINFELKPTNLIKIKNYTYEDYDIFINSISNTELKTELIDMINTLIEIIGLNKQMYPNLLQFDNISHKMIEIFMILTNWYGGNYLLNTIKSNPILRVQNSYILGEDFNMEMVPIYARPFLSVSANYINPKNPINTNDNLEQTTFIHSSLGISNYTHLSSPMRRFIDIINHLTFYNLNLNLNLNLETINIQIKNQKKIDNAWKLICFIKSNPQSNRFKACLFDWVSVKTTNKIIGTLVLYQQENNFISMVNVELPQIESTTNLTKYIEWNVELYYNSNNFKCKKFPFSIKII